MSEIFHVHPIDDLREHATSGWPANRCWCNPSIQEEDEGTLIVHNSMDRREEYEQGRKPS